MKRNEISQDQAYKSENKTVLDFFSDQVIKTPSKIALKHGNRSISFQDLNLLSNQIARQILLGLEKSNDKKKFFIVLVLNRSIDMIASILAVLKSGAAYVPIDPDCPTNRLQYIIQDVKANMVLTHGPCAERFEKNLIDIPVLNLDQKQYLQNSGEDIANVVSFLNTAYVIYTSGTTGKPKGVVVSHGALSYFILSFINYYDITENSIMDFSASYAFTGSIPNYFPFMVAGAKLVIQPEGILLQQEKYVDSILGNKIKLLKFTPSVFNFLFPVLKKQLAATNLKIILSGERLAKKSVIDALENTAWDIFNQYGFTECVAGLTRYMLNLESLQAHGGEYVPIGKPYPGREIIILGDDGKIISEQGEAGELLACGMGFFDKYINDDNANKIVTIENKNYYKTGDIAKYNQSFDIEVLSRNDSQVKLNGIRVELSEIERNILQHNAVKEVCVRCFENKQTSLVVAYYTLNLGMELTETKLKECLLRKLPRHMVPSKIINIEEMPRTSNGKVDWRKLPSVNKSIKISKDNLSTEELKIFDIWKSILSRDCFDLETDFFGAGGNSLQSFQLLIKINDTFKTNKDISFIFNKNTIFKQAKSLKLIESNDLHLINEVF